MARLIGHIGSPHGPYRFSDVRCERKGFLSIYTYRVDSMSYRIEVMERGHAVVVLPVDFSKGTIILIRQPRFNVGFVVSPVLRAMQLHAARMTGFRGTLHRLRSSLASALSFGRNATPATGQPSYADVPADTVLVHEMPAGMIDEGETDDEAVLRELHEETGIRIGASRIAKVATYYPSIGGMTERLTAYIADVSGHVPDLSKAGDGEESIDVWEFTFEEAFKMLRDGELESASSNILFRELRLRLLEGGYYAP